MSENERQTRLRALPAVGEIIQHPALQPALASYPRTVAVAAVRAELDAWRGRLAADDAPPFDFDRFLAGVAARLAAAALPKLRRVINATGVVVHTNLGRSPLAEEAIDAVATAARSYTNLEYDLAAGGRGSRGDLIEDLLCELTGAEAALAVNNNAGAVLLALTALARDREVVVSRGELIEIGGSFRLPEVLAQSGARLVEVGATNRTHLADYERAIGPETALLMKAHASNYRIVGFTAAVSGAALAELAHTRGLHAVEDLGSGSLMPTALLGLPEEPTAPDAVKSGLDLVTFSGDKLLGGPQAGVLVGKAELVRACARHPLHRALRADKLTLAALEATLRLYRDPAAASERIPTLRMLKADEKQLRRRANRLAAALKKQAGDLADIAVVRSTGRVGGGALPFVELPGPVVALRPRRQSADALARALRTLATPIVARIEDDAVVADPRTILDADEDLFQNGVVQALHEGRDRT
jgi:L-seryl-tRNA(Ser) seleniumtransferase